MKVRKFCRLPERSVCRLTIEHVPLYKVRPTAVGAASGVHARKVTTTKLEENGPPQVPIGGTINLPYPVIPASTAVFRIKRPARRGPGHRLWRQPNLNITVWSGTATVIMNWLGRRAMKLGTMLTGKAIAITGAAQGIGKATALVCAKEGGSVAVCDINGPLARAVAETINAAGGRAIAVEMDASLRGDCTRMVTSTVNAFGRMDGLVCGGMRRAYAPAEDLTEDAWNMVISQGLSGYFRCAQESGRQMLEQGYGAIVLISSIASRNAVDGGAAYCAVKAGVAGLTRQLGVEWARRGVRTNAVAPGFTSTEGALRKMSDEEAKRLIPIGRPARAEEIGNLCAFLLSDLSSHITAQEIIIDGGYTAGKNFSAGDVR